jgi:putative radical SAM enzyme (TIGR03279 family)
LLPIAAVLPGSTASRHGFAAGDRLVSVNGRDVRDSIDYQFLVSGRRLSLLVRKKDGTERALRISKDPDDTLGLLFDPFPVRRCRNKCIFCFVDQMPAGCRKSLYVRDDDYRASFLCGNYVTLGNLSEADWERIFAQRLSPLYLSVHATEPELRSFLMKNRSTSDIMAGMRRLAAGGIRMHTQIVLCPGINDGRHLSRTIEDLASLYPSVISIAVVPVGLTAHRTGLFPLRSFRRGEARRVLETVHAFSALYKKRLGTRLVFPSDEFYIKAGYPFPSLRSYEDLPQIENGVGMVATFLNKAQRMRLPSRIPPTTFSVVTGVSFAPILKAALRKYLAVKGVSIKVLTAKNVLFGPSVTVSGLLAGKDILQAVRGRRLGSMLLVPATSLKEDEDVFLDDMSLADLKAAVGVPVHPVGTFCDIVRLLRPAVKSGQRRDI